MTDTRHLCLHLTGDGYSHECACKRTINHTYQVLADHYPRENTAVPLFELDGEIA